MEEFLRNFLRPLPPKIRFLVIVVRVVVFKPDNGRFLFRADATFVKVLRLGARPVSCRLRPIGCQSLEIRTFHETPEKQDWVGRGCTRR